MKLVGADQRTQGNCETIHTLIWKVLGLQTGRRPILRAERLQRRWGFGDGTIFLAELNTPHKNPRLEQQFGLGCWSFFGSWGPSLGFLPT